MLSSVIIPSITTLPEVTPFFHTITKNSFQIKFLEFTRLSVGCWNGESLVDIGLVCTAPPPTHNVQHSKSCWGTEWKHLDPNHLKNSLFTMLIHWINDMNPQNKLRAQPNIAGPLYLDEVNKLTWLTYTVRKTSLCCFHKKPKSTHVGWYMIQTTQKHTFSANKGLCNLLQRCWFFVLTIRGNTFWIVCSFFNKLWQNHKRHANLFSYLFISWSADLKTWGVSFFSLRNERYGSHFYFRLSSFMTGI